MAQVTLTALRARVRELADMVGSDFVTDAASSLDAFINAAADELYDLLVDLLEDYALTSSAFTTTTGSIPLPTGFFKLAGVDLTVSGEEFALQKFTLRERHRVRSSDVYAALGPALPQYRLEGNTLRLRPAPTASVSGTIWFRPARTPLTAPADELDGVNGWEEYVVVDAAIRCVLKEEGDVSALMAMKAGLRQRILESAKTRDIGQASRVVDTDGLVDPW